MHKDHKHKRAAVLEIQEREFRQPKKVDKATLERFRAKPYQLEYVEKLRKLRENG